MMEIIHDKEKKTFTLPLENGEQAYVLYTFNQENEMLLVHSEVPYSQRGNGVGKELVLKTFEQLTEEGHKAIAVCSYIKAVARRSDQWKDIIKY